MRVDLHAHTTASDGTLSPEDLVALARAIPLSHLAITDHDHVAGVARARAAAAGSGLEIVPGVELSIDAPAGQLHMLGYFVDVTHARFLDTLASVRTARGPRAEAILAKLDALGMPLSIAEVHRQAAVAANPDKALGRPHVAAAMLARGYVASIEEAFDLWLAEGKPAHVPKRKLSAEEGVRAIREAGGVAVLAHPFTLPEDERRSTLERLARVGLEGVEIEYPRHDAALRASLRGWAKELDLVETGGSDFHGAMKPDIALGTGLRGNIHVGPHVVEDLRSRARGPP